MPDDERTARTLGDRNLFLVFSSGSIVVFVALCVLGALVGHGQLSGLDAYALQHWMPYGRGIPSGGGGVIGELLAYPNARFHPGAVVRLPASAATSCLLAVVLCAIVWRRGRRASAVLWLGAFVAVNLAEGFGKLAITKPTLYALVDGTLRATGFHHSFPSGHAARATILAAVTTAVWPRLWPLFAAWVVAVVVSAELDAIHTPSDIAGGLLLAAAAILAVLAVQERWGEALDARLRAGRRESAGSERVPARC